MKKATSPNIRFSFRRAMSVLSGATGVASAIFWHHSSSAQIKAAAISHGLSLNADSLRRSLSSYPDLASLTATDANNLLEHLNNLALIENNIAAAFAMAASLCVAAALLSEK